VCRGRDWEKEGPVDRVFSRYSMEESKELIRLTWTLNDPVSGRRVSLCVLRHTYIGGCNNFIVVEQRNKEDKIHIVPGKNIMLWYQRLRHIGEKGLQTLRNKCMVESMYNLC
jgi:hypothetical protein